MKRSLKRSVLALGLLAITAQAGGAQGQRLFDVDDALKLEAVHAYVFDPGHRRLLIQKLPRYDRIGSYGNHQYIVSHMTRILVFDRGAETGVAPLFPQAEGVGYFLSDGPDGGVSPDGSRVIVYRLKQGTIGVGLFDFARNTMDWLPIHPVVDPLLETAPVWISRHEFVMSVFGEGEQHSRLTRKFRVVDQVGDMWRRAVRGRSPTAKRYESAPVDTDANRRRAADFRDGRLVLVNAERGTVTTIADGIYSTMTLSPDRKHLAGLRHGGVLLRIRDYPILAQDVSKYRLQPVVFDIDAGFKPAPLCDACAAFVTRVDWSPSSANVSFFVRDVDDYWNKGAFLTYSTQSGTAARLDHSGLDLAPVSSNGRLAAPDRPAWIADRLAVFARPIEGVQDRTARDRPTFRFHISDRSPAGEVLRLGRPDWYLLGDGGAHVNLTGNLETVSFRLLGQARGSAVVLGDGALWRVSADGATALTPDIGQDVSVFPSPSGMDPFRSSRPFETEILLKATVAGEERLFSYDQATRSVRRIEHAADWLGDVQHLSWPGRVAITAGGTGHARTISLVDLRTRQKRALFELNTHLADVRPMRQESIEYDVVADGRKRRLRSCLILPPDWSPGKRSPTIVRTYPLNKGRCRSLSSVTSLHQTNMAPLISNGYVVLQAGYDVGLPRSAAGSDPLTTLTAQTLAAVDAAVEAGYTDPERVGLYGISYGGIAALRAVVSSNGAANVLSHYGTWSVIDAVAGRSTQAGVVAHYESPFTPVYMGGAKPWEDPAGYIAASPFFGVDRIATPVMLIHSDLDQADVGQYRQMFEALSRLRKEAVYIEYRGEGHGLSSPANIRHKLRTLADWYDRHLKPAAD